MDDVTRIGDLERNSAMEALGEHMRAGRLDPHEYDERMLTVGTARTMAELRPIFADLPAPTPFQPATAPLPGPAARRVVPTDRHGNAPLGGRVGATLVAASPFIAVALFFTISSIGWLWFLLIPLSGAIVYGDRKGFKSGNREGCNSRAALDRHQRHHHERGPRGSSDGYR